MYGIGTVARLAQVSVRTLRHYDDMGLLEPAHVDRDTWVTELQVVLAGSGTGAAPMGD